jgi:hypothetical protein
MRALIALVMGLAVAGCSSFRGPVETYRTQPKIDDPYLSIPEQEKRGRDRMSMPEFSPNVAPPTGTDFPGPHGR